jgi:hypothetical protein
MEIGTGKDSIVGILVFCSYGFWVVSRWSFSVQLLYGRLGGGRWEEVLDGVGVEPEVSFVVDGLVEGLLSGIHHG